MNAAQLALLRPLMALVKEIAGFCQRRGGPCFAGWPEKILLQYLSWHIANHCVFIARRPDRSITAIAFARPMDAATMLERAKKGEPVFQWEAITGKENAYMFAEFVGSEGAAKEIARQAGQRFPDWRVKIVLTFRGKALVNARPLIERMIR